MSEQELHVGVITDVHANAQALAAVFHDIRAHGINTIWALGDIIGYGADPGWCTEQVMRKASECVRGNHDLPRARPRELAQFGPAAAAAIQLASEQLDPEAREYLLSRPVSLSPAPGVVMAHGDPMGVWNYVLPQEGDLGAFDRALGACPAGTRFLLCGHSHLPMWARTDGERWEWDWAEAGQELPLEWDRYQYIFNPGAVGQPRSLTAFQSRDPRAKWLELDGGRARWHRVAYDYVGAAEAIRAVGLPEESAIRLYPRH